MLRGEGSAAVIGIRSEVPERDRRASSMEFDHIYTLLDQEELGTATEWAERFKKDSAYRKYIQEPLAGESKSQKTAPVQTASKTLAKNKRMFDEANNNKVVGRRSSMMLRTCFEPLSLVMF